MAGRAEDRGLDLMCRIAGNVPVLVRGDPVRLRQIMTNLVGNAIKFTEIGSVTIELRCDSVADGTCVLCCSVADTGIGIDAGARTRLFRAFSQADVSTANSLRGRTL